jgi:hypothetical protein
MTESLFNVTDHPVEKDTQRPVTNREYWQQAETCNRDYVQQRIKLWDGVYTEIMKKILFPASLYTCFTGFLYKKGIQPYV